MSSSPGAFRLFGFPVRVSPFFLLVCAMLNPPSSFEGRELAKLGIWMAVVTVSVLWHELGHAFAMRRYGYAPSIELYGLGGLTRWNGAKTPTAGQRVLVSLAGPFAGFALGGAIGVIWFLAGDLGSWAVDEAIQGLLWANIGWGVLNLLPMVPWDGGQALHGVLDLITKGRGRKPTAVVTLVFGVALLALTGLVLHSIWLSILVIFSIVAGWRLWSAPDAAPRAATPPMTLSGLRELLAKTGLDSISALVLSERSDPGWASAARAIERDVLAREMSIGGRAQALELSAWAHLLGGAPEKARSALDRMPSTHAPSAALEGMLASRLGRYEEALEAARELDHEEEAGGRARLEAHALIGLGRIDDALARVDDADRDTGSFVVERLFSAAKYDAAADGAERLFARFSDPEDAYNAACSHARAGRPLDGLSWIERAIEAGYRDADHLERDDDLASLRALPEFARLRDRARAER